MKAWPIAMLALLAAPAHASGPRADAALARLQQRDGQLFATGWRLASANAPFCAGAAPALGLSLLDAAAFADPAAVRRQLGLAGDLAIGAVAPGSPTDLAGLAANDTLVAIDGVVLAERFPRKAPAWQRLIDVSNLLVSAAARGPVTLLVARRTAPARSVVIAPVAACPTRFEVLDSGSKAMAEGSRVIMGRDFVGFGYPADEFAASVAHELAHNLLRHRAALDAAGRSLGNQRLTEREADRLMPWLLANAGYDPAAATRFMKRWGPRHDGGLFRNRTHEGWDERVEAIVAELALVEAAMIREGKADWARLFRREALD